MCINDIEGSVHMKKVTIQDLAEELNLSRNTVAKALNGGNVSYETKMTVVQKACEMGYSKLDNQLLEEMNRMMKDKNTGTILVLFNRSESYFWNRILTGISDELNKKGYRMQLHIVDENDITGEETLKLVAPDVKAIIFLCIFPIEFAHSMSKAGLPITFFNVPVDAAEYLAIGDIITLEGRYSVSKVVQKVIDMDKKSFGFIGYTKGSKTTHDRYSGFLETLRKNNLKPEQDCLFTRDAKSNYYEYEVIERIILNLSKLPEVFVCANDDIAKYVASALAKIDIKKAQDIVLIGFDNTVEKEFFKSDIYTVDIHKEAVGRRLVKSVLDQIEEKMDHSIITLQTYPLV